MSLAKELDTRLKTAMKARDGRTLSTIRMVKSKLGEKQNAPDFKGELTDKDVLDVIGAYVKQLKKSVPEYEKAGEAGSEMLAGLQFEIGYLSEFLPKLLGEAETKELVDAAVREVPDPSPKNIGRVMGSIMGAHKGKVDPGLVRKLLEQALTGE